MIFLHFILFFGLGPVLSKCLALQRFSSVYWDTELDEQKATIDSSVDTRAISLSDPFVLVVGASEVKTIVSLTTMS